MASLLLAWRAPFYVGKAPDSVRHDPYIQESIAAFRIPEYGGRGFRAWQLPLAGIGGFGAKLQPSPAFVFALGCIVWLKRIVP